MMNRFFTLFIVGLFPFTILNGLSAAPIISILLFILSIQLLDNMNFNVLVNKKTILLLLFFIWCLITCCWSFDPYRSFITWIKVVTLVIIGVVISYNIHNLKKDYIFKVMNYLTISILGGIIVFFTEVCSGGYLSYFFYKIFYRDSHFVFQLFFLDRGCALLSVLLWPVVGFLLYNNDILLALLLYVVTLFLLFISDSSSSYLAYIISSLVALSLFFTRFRVAKIFLVGVMSFFVVMPIFSYLQPYYVKQISPFIADSTVHRLYIWKFIINKIMDHLVKGWGYAASSKIPIDNLSDMIEYNGYLWSPLPLHPHNHMLQVLLETGVIGLVFFMFITYNLLMSIISLASSKKFKNHRVLLWQVTSIACFTNYFIIGAISFSMWQSWWVLSGMFTFIIVNMCKFYMVDH